jgi:hypothetical protein
MCRNWKPKSLVNVFKNWPIKENSFKWKRFWCRKVSVFVIHPVLINNRRKAMKLKAKAW